VHSAVLKGRRVAVKVRHPGVAEQIELDFRLMRKVSFLFVLFMGGK
jgi:predicted unusual protein kinase regulating ubiquinone biosynthesis (AarF/ABC1/UbiB family)